MSYPEIIPFDKDKWTDDAYEEDKKVADAYGYCMECWSPLELRAKDDPEDFRTHRAAEELMDKARKAYKRKKGKKK